MALIEIDFRLAEVEYELWALKEHLGAVEEQIRFLTAQDRIRTEARLRESGLSEDDSEVSLALQDHEQRVKHVLPRYLRGGFVVSLMAVFEAAVGEIADHLRKQAGVQLRPGDIRGDLIERAEKYYRHLLGRELFPDAGAREIVLRAHVLRNSYAHANGRLEATYERDIPRLKAWMEQGAGLSEDHGFVIPSEHFASELLDAVRSTLRPLMEAVWGRKQVHSSSAT